MLNPVQRVGFAGLGAMGGGIARRLADAGYDVTGWNRTKAKAQPLLDTGLGWAGTPRELAASSDVLFTMLTDSRALDATADGDDGILAGLRPGTVWADLSTIAPDASVALS
jgi:3-hydroxyisobutyrate dehydrogenase-like beta-hydroxyacid dehydrogenase